MPVPHRRVCGTGGPIPSAPKSGRRFLFPGLDPRKHREKDNRPRRRRQGFFARLRAEEKRAFAPKIKLSSPRKRGPSPRVRGGSNLKQRNSRRLVLELYASG